MSKNRNRKIKIQKVPAGNAPDTVVQAMPAGGWITDRAWISGLAGMISIFVIAFWFHYTNALGRGIYFAGFQVTTNSLDTMLMALFMCTAAMLTVEGVRLWLWNRPNFFHIDPKLRDGRYLHFIGDALVNYFLNLALLWVVIWFFHTAGEYGFKRGDDYYQGWFRFLDIVLYSYLIAGLPYVLVTRAFKHDPESDRRDLSGLMGKVLLKAGTLLRVSRERHAFDEYDKKATRALLVKLFFTPLMTHYFLDNFSHMVSNIGYMLNTVPDLIASNQYTHSRFNNDLYNVSVATIFSIDVGLAWCGYVISSRWVDNQTVSAEPTMLGWLVALICYPPFQMVSGLYYASPGEKDILFLANQWATTIFTTMMVLSYVVYMMATLWFGVRFSNLTNRGIIRKGPYAIVRHPAYASKNFSWWLVMFPVIVYNATHTGLQVAVLQTVGLVFITWIYYLRAITEERHLGVDPYYQDYCRQVKYRFIPGVI
jgi:protein-S-isoprenylcysteine O-methyltransferase Ste14